MKQSHNAVSGCSEKVWQSDITVQSFVSAFGIQYVYPVLPISFFSMVNQKVCLFLENLDQSNNLAINFELLLFFFLWLIFIPVSCSFKSWVLFS